MSNTEPVPTIRQVFEQLEEDFLDYHNGSWDYDGPKPIEKAIAQCERICVSEQLKPLQRIATIRNGEDGNPETISNHVFEELASLQTQLERETRR